MSGDGLHDQTRRFGIEGFARLVDGQASLKGRMTRRQVLAGLPATALAVAAVLAPHRVAARRDDDPPVFRNRGHQFTLLRSLRPAPLVPIRTADGRVIDLGRFRGDVVLLTFWATWCAPCVYEMPALDRLQGEMRGKRLKVVAVSIDCGGLAAVAPFYQRLQLKNLDIYLDPEQRTAYFETTSTNRARFALYGLPITYVIDHEGLVAGYIYGASEWDSGQAKRFLRYYVDRAGRGQAG